MRALGANREKIKALKAQPNIISKIKDLVRAQRTGKTLGSCRTTLQGCFGDNYASDCTSCFLHWGFHSFIPSCRMLFVCKLCIRMLPHRRRWCFVEHDTDRGGWQEDDSDQQRESLACPARDRRLAVHRQRLVCHRPRQTRRHEWLVGT